MGVSPYLIAFLLGAGAPGSIKSVEVLGDTTLDASAGIGVNPSGWVAKVVLNGISSTTGTCTASDFTLTVSDPGYLSDGTTTTVSRTIAGVAHLRRRSPNGNLKQTIVSGTDLEVYVSLSDWVFSGTTIVSAAIGGSFWSGAVSSVASLATSRTNTSSIPYIKPSFAWVNSQWGMSGSTLSVEALAYHPYGRNAQQVACVEYVSTDGTNSGSSVRVSSPSLSTQIAQGFPPEVWAASVDTSTLTNGASCTVNAIVKPWLGDSTAILNLSTGGVAWPTHLPQTLLNFVCDRTGGYAGGYAYVQVGSGGGVVSATPATAAASPYGTINAALTALRTWNGSNKGHTDIGGGTIRVMDASGSSVTHTISAGVTTTWGGTGLCTIEKDPAATGVVSVTWSALSQYPNRIRWKNLRIAPAASTYNITGPNTAGSSVVLEGCTLDSSASSSSRFLFYYEYRHIINPIFSGTNPVLLLPLPDSSGTAVSVTFLGGATQTATTAVPSLSRGPLVMAGCNLPSYSALLSQTSLFSPGLHGILWANNRVLRIDISSTVAQSIFNRLPTMVQNLVECNSDGLTGLNMNADGDLSTVDTFRYDAYNGCYGARSSRDYNDSSASNIAPSGIIKRSISKNSIVMDTNWKGDTYPTGSPVGGVGSWSAGYHVGKSGFVSLLGAHSKASTDAPHNDQIDVPYLGMAWPSGNIYNAQSLGMTPTQIIATFTNYTVYPRASPAIGGDYKPLSSASYLHGLIPVGMQGLKYDILGVLRRNDGTGAVGPVES